jgi:GDPmannose 4,6-dehydratase
MPVALITGVLGQDGSLLSELLLGKGYRVAGLELGTPAGRANGVELLVGDVSDRATIERAVAAIEPDEIYHLAGQSSVGRSFTEPALTFATNALSTLHVLDVARLAKRRPRVLLASSGEIFGDTGGTPATESTPVRPVSPYGAAKSAAAHLVATYRASFGLFACQAFFYNHESPRRPKHFVTQKIVRSACRIARGLDERIELGDTSVVRDWGFAPEYVEAAWRMLQASEPEDFVIATGESCSLEHFVERAFQCVGLSAKAHVVRKPDLIRPSEIQAMRADPTRAAERLDWRASVHVDELVERLVAHEQRALTAELASR